MEPGSDAYTATDAERAATLGSANISVVVARSCESPAIWSRSPPTPLSTLFLHSLRTTLVSMKGARHHIWIDNMEYPTSSFMQYSYLMNTHPQLVRSTII
ncbi:hypothetical protein FQN51_008815 [Onygenales sp. PD_10]|nr:hypothetical protein FQN51_008815 [Onygenales sp. PD_10]